MDSISRQIQASRFGAGRSRYLLLPMAMAATYNPLMLLSVFQRHLRQRQRADDPGQIAQRRRDDIVG